MTTYVCLHGHAYQPPREDPATGEVESQPTAAPFHDWNDRIAHESYLPLAQARVLDDEGQVRAEHNLWASMSFDLGPTLGVWMDRHVPDIAAAIAAGDELGGGAMAHPWVHAILPLTPVRDRQTIIAWGIEEFRSRFGRPAQGMWLPETAADTASLEALADAGISWTMLAPHQVRGAHGEPSGHRPLRVTLPSGRPFVIVPYDGPLSHAVAFGELLSDGVALAHGVVEHGLAGRDADETSADPPLVIASADIETFGHHHRFSEMALARAMEEWATMADVVVTNPQHYLDRFPPTRDGVLVERTSWSCSHGIERWRSDCGCRMDVVEGQDQRWRAPLRDVLDALADASGRLLDAVAGADLVEPWSARQDYGVVLSARPADRDRARREFLAGHVAPGGSPERALEWMEAERLRLEAWSSCAWFFDTPDRIETLQVLAQATAAAARYDELTGGDLCTWLGRQIVETGLVDAELVDAALAESGHAG